uniref:BG1 n=1 Tax=Gallus gallus TaxID=9031 RepID=A0A1C9U476_CHICK|nr:BG1 [Gallus gallus]
MHFLLGCNHPSFTLPWRTLLPYLVALHLLQPGSAQLRVVAPSLRVTANVGQDVVLRCQLSPCKDAWSSDIRWIQHRTSGFVHHYQNGEDLEQMEEYKGRTELLRDGLSDGNLDLRITAVSTSDSGSYSCAVQDGDGYADAVVDLEVSDPFSQITHPWKVALAVIVTILVGSFVITVFLYRKKAETTKQKGKDAELERMDAKLGTLAAELERRDAKLETLVENLERRNAEFAEKLASELERRDAKLETLVENLERRNAEFAEKLASELERRDAKLETLAESLERRNAEFAEKLASDLERRNAQLDKLASDLVQQTKAVEKLNSQWSKLQSLKLTKSDTIQNNCIGYEKSPQAVNYSPLSNPEKHHEAKRRWYIKSDYPQYPNQRGVGPAHAGTHGTPI